MIPSKRLAAAFAFGAGLAAAGVALAQAQTGSPAPPAASAQQAPPPVQSALPGGTLPSAQPQTPTKPYYTDTTQPTYSVDPPPDTPSGVYLPAAVLGYAKSAAGCVTIGCDDGPHAGGAAGPPTSAAPSRQSPAPVSSGPPADPEPSAPH
jgi:hypothetical protein